MSPVAFRQACRAYAEKFVAIQRDGVRAPGHPGRVGRAVPHDGAGLPGRRSCASWRPSWRRASSTRPRSPCTGASRAAPRWPRPRSSTTSTTRARRSTCASPLAEDERATLEAPLPRARRQDVFAVIWTTTPWTLPANLALAFHPDADYGFYPVEGTTTCCCSQGAEDRVADGASWRSAGRAADGAGRAPGRGEGRGARAPALPPSLDRPRLAGRARRLRHPRHRHRRRPHRARPRLGRLPDRRALRPRHLLPGGRGAAASCPRWSASRARRSSTPTRRSSRSCRSSGALLVAPARNATPTRSAGAARTRSSSAPPSSGSSPSTARRACASARSRRSARCAGTRPGARSASAT